MVTTGGEVQHFPVRLGLRAERMRDLVALLTLWLVAALFIAPALPTDRALLPLDMLTTLEPWLVREAPRPHNTLLSDVIFENLPNQLFVSAQIRQGQLPLWDPHALLGRPIMGDPNAQPFYPLTYLLAWLPAPRAMTLAALIHLMLAGSLMYLLLRAFGVGRLGAWLAGVAYMLNGVFVVWLEYPPFLASGAWVPGALLGYELALRQRRPLYAALGGLALALSLLGGQVQYSLLTGLILAAYALVNAYGNRAWRWPLGLVTLQGVVALGGASVQLVATGLVLPYSERLLNSYATLLGTRLPWSHLVLLVAPDFFGHPVNGTYWGPTNYNEQTAYFGLVPLLLALAAPLVRRTRLTLFWAGVALVATLWITGTLVLRLADVVPGLGYFNLPRLLYLFPLCGSILAGLLLDGLNHRHLRGVAVASGLAGAGYLGMLGLYVSEMGPNRIWQVGEIMPPLIWLALSLLALLLAARWTRLRPLLLALAVADLFAFGARYNPVTTVDQVYPDRPLIERLRADLAREPHRIAPLHAGRLVMGPNIPGVLGLYEVGGYTSLPPARLNRLFDAVDNYVAVPWMNVNTLMLQFSQLRPRLLGMFNVRYFLTAGAPSIPDFDLTAGCAEDTGPVYGPRRVSQTFMAQQAGLHRIDVRFRNAGESQGRAVIRLQSADLTDTFTVADIELASLLPDTSYPLYFQPLADSAGRVYRITVAAPDGTPATAPRVCLAPTGSAHHMQRFEDDTPTAGRLAVAAYSLPTGELRRRGTFEGVRIYHNDTYVPRAYIVYQLSGAANEADALGMVIDPTFDPLSQAVVETPPPVDLSRAAPELTEVELVEYTPQRVVIRARPRQPGLLVLADQDFPGWEALVDGVAAPIVRTNYVVRGVYLDAGAHEVVFQFRPWPVYLGLGVSLLTFMVTLLAVLTRLQLKGQTGEP